MSIINKIEKECPHLWGRHMVQPSSGLSTDLYHFRTCFICGVEQKGFSETSHSPAKWEPAPKIFIDETRLPLINKMKNQIEELETRITTLKAEKELLISQIGR